MQSLFLPKTPNTRQTKLALAKNKQRAKSYYDRTAKPLPRPAANDLIRAQIQDTRWQPAIVKNKHSDRSFTVRTHDGNLYRRNRHKLIKSHETDHPCQNKSPQCPINPPNVMITSEPSIKLMGQIEPGVSTDTKQTPISQQMYCRSGRLLKPKNKYNG